MPQSWLFSSSFLPPPLPVLHAGTSPEWVLLDTKAYLTVDDRRNGTTAMATTREGHVVQVSFHLADPPAISHLCVHCPGLDKTHFTEEPHVVCSEKNITILLISFRFPPTELVFTDYFVYRAHPEHPSLDRLPSLPTRVLARRQVGLLPCHGDDGEDDSFVLAALRPRLDTMECDLHTFSSRTGRWRTKLALLEHPRSLNSRDDLLLFRIDKVIALQGGSLAWVDLWRGALLCNVLNENPVARYIRMPPPAIGNKGSYSRKRAQLYRDVTYSKDFFKFVEIERYQRPAICRGPSRPDIVVFSDDNDLADDLDDTPSRTWYGWRAATWSRKLSSNSWYKDSMADVDEIVVDNPTHSSLLPELKDGYPGKSTLQNLITTAPILSIHGDDVVYLLSKVDSRDQNAWVIGVDMKTKTVQGVASFSVDRSMYSSPAYRACSLSGYLNMSQHL